MQNIQGLFGGSANTTAGQVHRNSMVGEEGGLGVGGQMHQGHTQNQDINSL